MSFRLKTILGVALIEVILLVILVWNGMSMMHQSSESQLLQRAETTASLFSSMVKDAVLSYDLATLETFVSELMKNEGLVYVRIYDQDQMLAAAGDEIQRAMPFIQDHSLEEVNDAVFDIEASITEAGQQYGRVQLGLSTTLLEEKLTAATIKTSSLAVIEILLSALFSFLLGSWLVKQLEVLRHASSEIASGQLGVQIPIKGSDEIAETANYFNQMSLALQRSTDALNQLNTSLEDQVTERTRQLAYANQSLQSILESMSEILLVVDDQGQIQLTNPASQRLLGYEEKHLVNQDLHVLLAEDDKRRLDWMMQEQVQSGEEFALLTASGEWLPVLMMASRIDDQEQGFTVITAQDLRELKRAEEGERYLSFQEGLNEMSANILHNIGNNLAGIQGGLLKIEQQSDNLRKVSSLLGGFSQKVLTELDELSLSPQSILQKAPQILQKSALSIEQMVEREIGGAVKDIHKLSDHIHSVIQATPLTDDQRRSDRGFEFKDLLRDVEILLAEKIKQKEVSITQQITLQVGRLKISRNLMLQAMVHLVSNSLDAIEKKGAGEILIAVDEEVREKGRRWLIVQVLDNGCGIEESNFSKVVKSGFSTKHDGKGNGLHAVGNYVNAIQGRFEISNRKSTQGVSVKLAIPLDGS